MFPFKVAPFHMGGTTIFKELPPENVLVPLNLAIHDKKYLAVIH